MAKVIKRYQKLPKHDKGCQKMAKVAKRWQKMTKVAKNCEILRDAPHFQMNFRKSSEGGGGIFNPKIYIAEFGPLNRAFSA